MVIFVCLVEGDRAALGPSNPGVFVPRA